MTSLLIGIAIGSTLGLAIRFAKLETELFQAKQELFWTRQRNEALDKATNKAVERWRRWRDRALTRRVRIYEREPGIHLVHDVNAPPDELPPSAAIVAPRSQ